MKDLGLSGPVQFARQTCNIIQVKAVVNKNTYVYIKYVYQRSIHCSRYHSR